MPDRDFMLWAATILTIIAIGQLFGTCSAYAQPVIALEQGQAAPHAGMLIEDDRLVAWRREIERLRFEVQLGAERCAMLRAADDQLDIARDLATTERLALQDRLWGARVADLIRERDAARAKQGPRWWQRGALWLPIGLVVGLVTGVVVLTAH